ncbi:hypothetical protein FSP39_015330 [Pinctada imbricata]|uniref:Uncharacterized protein n=1 Tax=Pinctada imbricata TaxID=66713 RepID=A0AA88XKX6_PINIB|nr:hypothetical protein FSP39_015330 [Pinctada imbricata]
MAESKVGPSVPKEKKRKTNDCVLERFCEEFGDSFGRFKELLYNLKQKQTALGAFEIGSCNAADPDHGYCFTKAACSIRPSDVTIAFGSLFLEPFKVLNELFSKKSLSKDGPVRMCVEKLMTFMLDKEIQKALEDIQDCTDETELSVLSATHLFSQLSLSPAFTVDNRKPGLWRCPCTGKKCLKSGRYGKINYGDTSIGNTEVWHGFLDLIMDGAEVLVYTVDGENDTDRDTDSTRDVKQKDFEMTDVSAGSSIAQVAAETIVYSFYYRYLHPEHSHFLIPSIGISYFSVVFYFYDSVNDVLLGSTQFPLMNLESGNPCKLNITTLFAIWMVLNHKHLCNGLNLVGPDQIPKSHFAELAKSKLEVYKEGLKRRDVDIRRKKVQSVDPKFFIDSKFLVPSALNFDDYY